MKEKTKQKGFIQIPLLITIIVGVLIIGGISYLAVREYQNYQIEQTEEIKQTQEKEQLAQADLKTQQEQLEKAQQEIETLKQKQTEQENKPSQIIVKETTTENDKLSQSLLDEILQRTVKITCISSTLKSEGSGFIMITSEDSNKWFVFTNAHVVVVGSPEDTSCVIGVPSKPDYSINKVFEGEIVDISHKFPTIDKAVLSVIGDRGFKNGVSVMPICKFNDVKIGDKITIVGYPAFGGSSLTATEGTISGFEETQYGYIYKTSAKIDSGNSGGTAVNNTKKCFLGMPTWATQGTFEGLGYIQSWEMINTAN